MPSVESALALLGLDAMRLVLLDLFSLNASPQADNSDTKAIKSSHNVCCSGESFSRMLRSKVPETGGATIDPRTLAIPAIPGLGVRIT